MLKLFHVEFSFERYFTAHIVTYPKLNKYTSGVRLSTSDQILIICG
ncbi:hypothetical protein L910_2510 [Vibrio fluvialis PG41]|uniref:Uncharacterized protein n=1 Tax=Vibrio fluvialis PG41 TaxID=1336752 RepID=S7HWP8_VIBFL|nr:hypothetical protein L910_2510 [Vibrio fluvialis PG41]